MGTTSGVGQGPYKMDGHGELDSLITILDKVHASEFVLYVEPGLVPLLSCISPYSTLQNHGVAALIPLTQISVEVKQNTNAVVYITRASPQSVELIAKSAKQYIGLPITVAVTPEIPPSVPLLFTQFGVLGDLDLVAWPTSLIPDAVCPDLLNLFCTESTLDPASGVWPLVHALDTLQANVTGAFGKTVAVGPRARHVAALLDQRRAEHAVVQQMQAFNTDNYADYHFGYSSSTFFGTAVEQLIIIDRDLDMVTPMICQTTYEGVLAETVGVSSSGTTQNGLKASLKNDPVFSSIAERGFAEACESLHVSAKELQEEYRAGSAVNNPETAPSIAEIRSIVGKLGSLQATQRLVDTHTELASLAMADLERGVRREAYKLQTQILEGRITTTQAVARIQDLIFQGGSLTLVLRLLCLLCIVRGGLKENVLQAVLYGDMLKTYGYEHLKTIHYLYERGLVFSPRNSSFLFSSFTGLGSSEPTASTISINTNTSTNTTGTTNNIDNKSGTTSMQRSSGSSAEVIDPAINEVLASQLSQTYSWYANNKAYKLFPSESPESQPYAGFVPLTARIVQMALDIIPKYKTPLEQEFVERKFVPRTALAAREAKLRRTLLRNSPNATQPTVLVVIVGGVTYAESTAIKAAAAGQNKRLIIAATTIITGDDVVTT